MRRRVYSDREKAEYLAILAANGGDVSRTAAMTGVPAKTLYRWRDGNTITPEILNIENEKRSNIYDLITDEMYEVLGLAKERRKDGDYRALMTAFGILFDKRQLLTGEATGNLNVTVRYEDGDDVA